VDVESHYTGGCVLRFVHLGWICGGGYWIRSSWMKGDWIVAIAIVVVVVVVVGCGGCVGGGVGIAVTRWPGTGGIITVDVTRRTGSTSTSTRRGRGVPTVTTK